MNANTSDTGTIKSDKTLISIIEALRDKRGAGVTELARQLGLSKSVVHKHLKTMLQEGYVINRNGNYDLDFKFVNLAGTVMQRSRLCRLSRTKVNEIADETEYGSSFSIRSREFNIFLYCRNYKFGLENEIYTGKRHSLQVNAPGKAILAELADEEIEDIIDRSGFPKTGPNTITSESELFDQIEEIRKRNYALNLEESREGVHAVAASVRDRENGMLGALSIGGPAQEIPIGKLNSDVATLLLAKVNELELQLKYQE